MINIMKVNYKRAFFTLLIIFIIIISLDIFFTFILPITIPSSPDELCYNLSWDWNDYVECMKNIN